MPDQHIDGPPDVPGDIQRDTQLYKHTTIQMDIQMHRHTNWCTDMPKTIHMAAQQDKMHTTMTTPKCKRFILFKVNYLLLKELENIRELSDHTGNEPTLDIPMTTPKWKRFILFKASYLLLKGLENIRKLPDHTGYTHSRIWAGQKMIHTISNKHVNHEYMFIT